VSGKSDVTAFALFLSLQHRFKSAAKQRFDGITRESLRMQQVDGLAWQFGTG
jgi:hypothetical protein